MVADANGFDRNVAGGIVAIDRIVIHVRVPKVSALVPLHDLSHLVVQQDAAPPRGVVGVILTFHKCVATAIPGIDLFPCQEGGTVGTDLVISAPDSSPGMDGNTDRL